MSAYYHQLNRETGIWEKKHVSDEMLAGTFRKVFATVRKRLPKKQYAGKWRAYITVNGKSVSIGNGFESQHDALVARDKEAIKRGLKTNILKPLNKKNGKSKNYRLQSFQS